jgi:hypothetical protein
MVSLCSIQIRGGSTNGFGLDTFSLFQNENTTTTIIIMDYLLRYYLYDSVV